MDVKIVVFAALVCLTCYVCTDCGVNEVFNSCASACEPSCVETHPACPDHCDGARCQCVAGYVRNEQNVCVLPTECP